MRPATFKYLEENGHPYSRRHTERLVKDGKFPAPIKISEHRIIWDLDEVDAHYARLKAQRSRQ